MQRPSASLVGDGSTQKALSAVDTNKRTARRLLKAGRLFADRARVKRGLHRSRRRNAEDETRTRPSPALRPAKGTAENNRPHMSSARTHGLRDPLSGRRPRHGVPGHAMVLSRRPKAAGKSNNIKMHSLDAAAAAHLSATSIAADAHACGRLERRARPIRAEKN